MQGGNTRNRVYRVGIHKTMGVDWDICNSEYRVGALLFMVIHVIYKYKNK